MVFYECLLTAKNTAHFDALTNLVKKVSLKVVENGGVVRSIRNHGIRDLPHRFRAKYPDSLGNRYYEKGRFVSIYYDASPLTQREVSSIINLDELVLRQTHLRARSTLDFIHNTNENKNPYIQKVQYEEYKREQQQAEAVAEAVQDGADEAILTMTSVEEATEENVEASIESEEQVYDALQADEQVGAAIEAQEQVDDALVAEDQVDAAVAVEDQVLDAFVAEDQVDVAVEATAKEPDKDEKAT